MPELSRRTSGGYTHTEPSTWPYAPRLFHIQSAAKQALTWYMKGVASVDYSRDWETGVSEEIGIRTDPPSVGKPRRREDWEIVKVILRVERGV